jgi:hypothetical protein
MKVNALSKPQKQPLEGTRRPHLVSVHTLHERYVVATRSLGTHFPIIDAWLADQEPDFWYQIRLEDDELLRLRQLGVPERTYQAKLQAFLELCALAEQLYYDARPTELSLPALSEGERVAVYFELAGGSLLKVSAKDE